MKKPKRPMYRVYAYVGGLSSHNVIEIWYNRDIKSAYAKLQEYLEAHPECVKCYVEETFE